MDRKSVKPMVMYLLPFVVLVALAIFFSTGKQLQRPAGTPEDFPLYIEQLREDLEEEDWVNARSTLKDLEASWDAVIPRIRYSVERKQIEQINDSLTRVREAVERKEKTSALKELAELKDRWNRLGTPTLERGVISV